MGPMGKWIALLGDICVIIFDLLLYSQMITLRNDTARNRGILFSGCGVIVALYILAVYGLSWPVAISTVACMTLPSLAMFWSFCKFRDARFFLTFCFVDTVSLIIGFIARYIGVLLGDAGSLLSIAIMLVSFAWVYKTGKPYFKKYREALEIIPTGWKRLTFSAALIYITIVFVAAYPKPLVERPEFLFPYFMICVMVLSFYAVMFTSISMTKRAFEQSKQLQDQQKWFKMAYVDALTEIPNRMAYMEKIHELERMKNESPSAAIIVLDLDHFKNINDTWGHIAGDEVLKQVAGRLTRAFSDENGTAYRIGGDEFAAITVGLEENAILKKLEGLEEPQDSKVPYSISFGYSFVDKQENNAVEQAFSRADAMMYDNKSKKE